MLAIRIIQFAQTLQEGAVLTAKELLHLGKRAALDQALHRLNKAEKLMRVGRGMYVLPIHNRFGVRGPDTAALLEDMAKKTGEPIVRHGAMAANKFGLTPQVPMHEIWMTAGRPKNYRIGKLTIRVDHAPKWQMVFPNTLAGDAIRAIAWMGETNATETVRKVKMQLTTNDWENIAGVRTILPTWMAAAVSEM